MKYIDPDGRMSVDHENNTVTCDINDSKDMQLTADFVANNEGFSVIGQDNNKGSSLSFSNADEFNEYRANPLTGGIKVGLIYDSGSVDVGGADFSIASLFLGFDCTGINFYVGGELEGPGFSSELLDIFKLKTRSVVAFAYLGLKDGSLGLGAFIASASVSGSLNFNVLGRDISITGSFYSPGALGGEVRLGAQGQVRAGVGIFGWGVDYSVR